jgi:trans-L-3-hydroxyproline dehydratase
MTFFQSVPSFAYALDVKVDVPNRGTLTVDIGYGGAFYALLRAAAIGLDVQKSPTQYAYPLQAD